MGRRTRATARRLVGAALLVALLPLPVAAARPPDVPGRHWARDAIEFVLDEGLFGLDGRGRFRPDDAVGRAVALRGLWLGTGAPEGHPPHGLIGVGARFEPVVRWAVAEGIDRGFADGTFRAADPVSRGQYLRWLWRSDGAPVEDLGPDGLLVPYPAAGLARAPRAAADWATAEGVLDPVRDQPFRPGDELTRAEAAQWLYRWVPRPSVEIGGRVVDTNRVELVWRARPTLSAGPLTATIDPGLLDEPELDVLPADCPDGGWCTAAVRTGRAGWTRYTLTVEAPPTVVVQAAADILVDRLSDPEVGEDRIVVDRLAPGDQVLSWEPPPGVDPGAPLATDFVLVFPPRSVLPLPVERPLAGQYVVPAAQQAIDEPRTWTMQYCRRPQGGDDVLEDVVCSAGAQVTFDPEGARFTGPDEGSRRRFVAPGDDLELVWSGPGDQWVLDAPTLLAEPLRLTTTAHTFTDLPEGVHDIGLVSCAGTCPADVSGLARDRLQVVAGLDGERPRWATATLASWFSIEQVDTVDRWSTGVPLDVAFDDEGDVWSIGEFGADVARVTGLDAPGGPTVTHHETPIPRADGTPVGAFANPFHTADSGPACSRSVFSALGERVITAGDHVWFTQGGSLGPPPPCVEVNHSRLVRFDRTAIDDPATRGDDRFCVVPVSGVNGQVVGVAHDPATDRIWFAEPSGVDGPAVNWFDEDEVACRNDLDLSDPVAVAEASAADGCGPDDPRPGCIHRIPLGADIAPAHLAVDATTDHLWITDFGGRVLSRLPLSGPGGLERFPMPTDRGGFFAGYPWQIRVTDDAVYIVEYSDNQIVRFDTTVADPTTACAALVAGVNPCMREVFLPMATDTVNAHSIALDGDRLWFTVANESPGTEDPDAAYLGVIDLATWTAAEAPTGVLFTDLATLGEPPAGGHRSPRGIEVDATTGRIAVAEMGREILVLTPR